jgi:hypothetical protein
LDESYLDGEKGYGIKWKDFERDTLILENKWTRNLHNLQKQQDRYVKLN